MFANRLSQQSALVESYVTGRGANQSGDRMLLHVFTHVKTFKVNSKGCGKLPGDFCFTDPGWSSKEKTASG